MLLVPAHRAKDDEVDEVLLRETAKCAIMPKGALVQVVLEVRYVLTRFGSGDILVHVP